MTELQDINQKIAELLEKKLELEEQIPERKERAERNLQQFEKAKKHLGTRIENPVVAYQGEPGAYSEMALIDFFGKDTKSIGFESFDDVFECLKKKECDYAMLPVENSSTGAIRQVYDLLAQYEAYIVGETTVAVRHNLMALPGVTLEDINGVYSHEQGIFQCEKFLRSHPDWKKIPQADTAGSAKMIAETNDKKKAAICSARAAEIYHLHILEKDINDNLNNTTRFVVVSRQMEYPEGKDKICIAITADHESGSLHEILTVFKMFNLNLVKIESRPIQGEKWQYMFFVEFMGDVEQEEVQKAFFALAEKSNTLRVFGNFKSNLEDE